MRFNSMFRTTLFKRSLVIFIILNIFLYIFIGIFNKSIPFESTNYHNRSHHYFDSALDDNKPFQLIRDLGVWDAQWYLKIAASGYPTRQVFEQYTNPAQMGGLTYAYFPLYPVILAVFNLVFQNIELTAFILSQVIMLAVFISLYYLSSKLYNRNIAVRSIFLLFLFPFSIFYKVYYTEGLFLLMLIWFGYFLIKNKWLFVSSLLSVMLVTRPSALPFILVFLSYLFLAIRKKKITIRNALIGIVLSIIPFLFWLGFCYLQTGDMLYWHTVQAVWYKSPSIFHTLFHNMSTIVTFWNLPFHEFRTSKIDTAMIIIVAVLLFTGRKFIKSPLWWISFVIWLTPLLTRDTMSYSRYQIISFPVFIYLASKVKGLSFYLLCAAFYLIMLVISIYLINWYWVA